MRILLCWVCVFVCIQYFCILANILKLCSRMQLIYSETVWSIKAYSLSFIRWNLIASSLEIIFPTPEAKDQHILPHASWIMRFSYIDWREHALFALLCELWKLFTWLLSGSSFPATASFLTHLCWSVRSRPSQRSLWRFQSSLFCPVLCSIHQLPWPPWTPQSASSAPGDSWAQPGNPENLQVICGRGKQKLTWLFLVWGVGGSLSYTVWWPMFKHRCFIFPAQVSAC